MATKDDFARYCAELLAPLGPTRVRRMFGGHGLYVDELFVAIVIGETLYLKVDDSTRAAFEAEGCPAFVYTAKGRGQVSLNYRAAPAEAMDSPGLMRPWAQRALEAAARARGK